MGVNLSECTDYTALQVWKSSVHQVASVRKTTVLDVMRRLLQVLEVAACNKNCDSVLNAPDIIWNIISRSLSLIIPSP